MGLSWNKTFKVNNMGLSWKTKGECVTNKMMWNGDQTLLYLAAMCSKHKHQKLQSVPALQMSIWFPPPIGIWHPDRLGIGSIKLHMRRHPKNLAQNLHLNQFVVVMFTRFHHQISPGWYIRYLNHSFEQTTMVAWMKSRIRSIPLSIQVA